MIIKSYTSIMWMSRKSLFQFIPLSLNMISFELIPAAPAMAGRISGVMATTGHLYNAASLSAGTPR